MGSQHRLNKITSVVAVEVICPFSFLRWSADVGTGAGGGEHVAQVIGEEVRPFLLLMLLLLVVVTAILSGAQVFI